MMVGNFLPTNWTIYSDWWFQTWLLFSISCMGCHPNPIDELIFFKMVKPPTSYDVQLITDGPNQLIILKPITYPLYSHKKRNLLIIYNGFKDYHFKDSHYKSIILWLRPINNILFFPNDGWNRRGEFSFPRHWCHWWGTIQRGIPATAWISIPVSE